jgi:hypothetical protein
VHKDIKCDFVDFFFTDFVSLYSSRNRIYEVKKHAHTHTHTHTQSYLILELHRVSPNFHQKYETVFSPSNTVVTDSR